MPPKKEDKLAGRQVLAPPSLWPDFPLPKGQKGWAGEAAGARGGRHTPAGMKRTEQLLGPLVCGSLCGPAPITFAPATLRC